MKIIKGVGVFVSSACSVLAVVSGFASGSFPLAKATVEKAVKQSITATKLARCV